MRRSYQSNRNVSSIISGVLPNTIILALSAMLFATFWGILFGIIAAFHNQSGLDRLILFMSTTGMALPSFFGAILFSWFFGYVLHQFTGLMPWGNLYVIDDYTGEKNISLKNLILPCVTLGIRPLSVIAQLTRNSMLEVMNADYVRTARAKGISEFTILFRHTLRNTLNPLITAISGWMGGLLAGTVFIEYIFGWKGIGKEIVDGLQKLDYPVVIGCVITVALIFVVINIIVDILYGWVDPRIRISQK
jgi:peptide/nickel transport system permease protein